MDVAYKLDCEWPLLAHTAVARALPRWHDQQPELRRFASPRQLLLFLHSAPAAQTDAILLALLTLARDDRLAGRTLLQVLLPALKRQAKRIANRSYRRDEVWELLLFFAWQGICCYPLQRRRRRVAANLTLQVLHDTTRALHRPDGPDDDQTSGDPRDRLHPPEHVARSRDQLIVELLEQAPPSLGDGLVRAGVAAGLISERDAELILRTRVDGIRLRLLAPASGVSYDALLKRRQRAEAALRTLLRTATAVRNAASSDLVSTERTRSTLRERAATHAERETRTARAA
jgi:hypothetical protein